MRLRFGGFYSYRFTANLLQSPTKNFENRLRFDKVIDISSLPRFYVPQCRCKLLSALIENPIWYWTPEMYGKPRCHSSTLYWTTVGVSLSRRSIYLLYTIRCDRKCLACALELDLNLPHATTNRNIAKYKFKKLSYRRGTARRSKSVEILSTTAQMYKKSHLKRLVIGEWPLEVTQGHRNSRCSIGHVSLLLSRTVGGKPEINEWRSYMRSLRVANYDTMH